VLIPQALVDDVVDAAVEQERLEGWIMREVEAGTPLPGLYPPNDAATRRATRPGRRRSADQFDAAEAAGAVAAGTSAALILGAPMFCSMPGSVCAMPLWQSMQVCPSLKATWCVVAARAVLLGVVHVGEVVAVAAFLAVVGLHARPLVAGQFAALGVELLRRVDGAQALCRPRCWPGSCG
jgi:hypothetical protein